MGLYKNIRVACITANKTINSVEKEVGFAQGTIRRWDKNVPSVERLKAVADNLCISLDEICKGVQFEFKWQKRSDH